MMRTTQIRNGNYRRKALPFSTENERARKKTKQMKNLSPLFQIGKINLNQYITNLSNFVGESAATKQKAKNANENSSIVDNDNGNGDDDGN